MVSNSGSVPGVILTAIVNSSTRLYLSVYPSVSVSFSVPSACLPVVLVF